MSEPIVVAASRGVGLKDFLPEGTRVSITGGGSIDQLKQEAMYVLPSSLGSKRYHIYFLCGIPDITKFEKKIQWTLQRMRLLGGALSNLWALFGKIKKLSELLYRAWSPSYLLYHPKGPFGQVQPFPTSKWKDGYSSFDRTIRKNARKPQFGNRHYK